MTTVVRWKQGLTLPHDKDDICDYNMDLTDVVGTTGDTVISVNVTATSVTAVKISHTAGGYVKYRVSGGTAGVQGSVTIQIVLASGRKQSRTVYYDVLER
jgi:hypothetical protein